MANSLGNIQYNLLIFFERISEAERWNSFFFFSEISGKTSLCNTKRKLSCISNWPFGENHYSYCSSPSSSSFSTFLCFFPPSPSFSSSSSLCPYPFSFSSSFSSVSYSSCSSSWSCFTFDVSLRAHVSECMASRPKLNTAHIVSHKRRTKWNEI